MEVEFELNGVVHRHKIDKAEFFVGRAAGADLRINDTTVSSRHARIVDSPQLATIEDLGSTNGTRLNNEQVRECAVKAGDCVTFGRIPVRIISIGSGAAPAAGADIDFVAGEATLAFASGTETARMQRPQVESATEGDVPQGMELDPASDLVGAESKAPLVPPQRLATVVRLASRLHAARRGQDAFDRIGAAAMQAVRAQGVEVFLADEGLTQMMRVVGKAADGSEIPPRDAAAMAPFLQLLTAGKAVLTPAVPGGAPRSLYAPLLAGDRLERKVGLLAAYVTGPASAADLRLLTLLAGEAAQALDVVRGIEMLRASYEELVKQQTEVVQECEALEEELAQARAAVEQASQAAQAARAEADAAKAAAAAAPLGLGHTPTGTAPVISVPVALAGGAGTGTAPVIAVPAAAPGPFAHGTAPSIPVPADLLLEETLPGPPPMPAAPPPRPHTPGTGVAAAKITPGQPVPAAAKVTPGGGVEATRSPSGGEGIRRSPSGGEGLPHVEASGEAPKGGAGKNTMFLAAAAGITGPVKNDLPPILEALLVELRPPVPIVSGLIDQTLAELSRGGAGPMVAQVLLPAKPAAANLHMLLNDVSELAELEAGKVKVEPVLVDAKALTAEVHHFEGMAAQAKGVKFFLDAPAGPTMCMADPRRLVQMLHHLVGTAVKLSMPGSEVTLTVNEVLKRVRFNVRDKLGPLVHNTLGLAIAKRLAPIMKTELTIEGDPSRGTAMWFTLPLPAAEKK